MIVEFIFAAVRLKLEQCKSKGASWRVMLRILRENYTAGMKQISLGLRQVVRQ
jgi:hypothetical protein